MDPATRTRMATAPMVAAIPCPRSEWQKPPDLVNNMLDLRLLNICSSALFFRGPRSFIRAIEQATGNGAGKSRVRLRDAGIGAMTRMLAPLVRVGRQPDCSQRDTDNQSDSEKSESKNSTCYGDLLFSQPMIALSGRIREEARESRRSSVHIMPSRPPGTSLKMSPSACRRLAAS
jgi:hypothetical protein